MRSLAARLRRNHGTTVAYLALFVALGGVSVAAITLPAKSVGTKQLKANAVVSGKVRNGSLLRKDFRAGQLPAGARGPSGVTGPTGPIGPAAFAEFFALMPPDNAATVAAGDAVDFPQDGPASGGITRMADDTFVLAENATYRVAFAVSVDQAGQLQLRLNGAALPYTTYGRATGASQIVGEALVTTTAINSVLELINPADSAAALTITPLAGGSQPSAASLVIEQLD